MSRIRSIKPEFWTSAQLLECSRDARLLFIGLWNFCDDAGRHVDSAKQIKAEIFPADDLLVENVRGMLDELSANGLIKLYTSRGQSLLQVTGWRHQRIDKKQAPRYPGPDDPGSGPPSENVPRTLPPDPIRSDPIRRDTIRSDSTAAPAANGHSAALAILDADVENFEAFKFAYPKRNGHQPWVRARRAISARLAEGSTWNEILEGTRAYAAWCRATGKEHTEHVMQAVTFCGPEKPFLDSWPAPPPKAVAAKPKFVAPPDEPEVASA